MGTLIFVLEGELERLEKANREKRTERSETLGGKERPHQYGVPGSRHGTGGHGLVGRDGIGGWLGMQVPGVLFPFLVDNVFPRPSLFSARRVVG